MYTTFTFWKLLFGSDPIMHWLHGYAISFAVAVGTLLISGMISPRSDAEIHRGERVEAPVDMTPWSLAIPASIVIVVLTVLMYVSLFLLAQ